MHYAGVATTDFLAHQGIYHHPQQQHPHVCRSQATPGHTLIFPTPSNSMQIYSDYMALELDNKHAPKVSRKAGKSLGSAFPRRSSDYVDFSHVVRKNAAAEAKLKNKKTSAETANVGRAFACIPEGGSRTAASCEDLCSSVPAWKCGVEEEDVVLYNHHKSPKSASKKSKFLPRFLQPSFLFRKRNKSKTEKAEELFIAVQNLPNLRNRSCTINNCGSIEQLLVTHSFFLSFFPSRDLRVC